MSKPVEVWTDERRATLRELLGTMSADEIGKVLFGESGRKNAVLGEAWRRGLKNGYKRPPGSRRKRKPVELTPSFAHHTPVSVPTRLPKRMIEQQYEPANAQLVRRTSELQAALSRSARRW